jgi:chromosomal replication initiation ATPase DnaA
MEYGEADDRASARLAASVAGYALGVSQHEIIEAGRGSANAAFARQVAMYLCHVAFEFSLARVAYAFRRDRSTVAHACHVIEDKRDDEAFDGWLATLEASLREAPALAPLAVRNAS